MADTQIVEHVGFTGTQLGMTLKQGLAFQLELNTRSGWFHHGDCVGSDEQAHTIAERKGFRIILHPPRNPSKRAWCKADQEYEQLDYLDRNHMIVTTTEELLATPGTAEEELRSGTWSTIRYARKLGRPITIILPDGSIRKENHNG